MRVLICGVIGAVVAAAAWLGLEHVTQKDMGWLALVVGLVTGMAVHKAAGPAPGGGYARGGLAALLALAAIVGGRQVYAKVMEAVNDTAVPVTVAAGDEEGTDDASGDELAGDATAAAEKERSEMDSRIGGATAGANLPVKKRFSEWETVWMCGAALLAYLVGKGPDVPPVTEEEAEGAGQSEEEPES